ncbi:hypothetical protein [Nitrosomonas sp. Nm34]|uniref:hypothetical protein n=1 Tax=Nitrosomonas sp. Nm34 TaxID=1881055 RepID=UPI0008EA98AB|nr:hypothetical protein [Nitrosomonas sp. Nm34]SFI98248.1 hypothetical protein SAMN05428978_10737 [Nitrosomonas sp. Nm34]
MRSSLLSSKEGSEAIVASDLKTQGGWNAQTQKQAYKSRRSYYQVERERWHIARHGDWGAQ